MNDNFWIRPEKKAAPLTRSSFITYIDIDLHLINDNFNVI